VIDIAMLIVTLVAFAGVDGFMRLCAFQTCQSGKPSDSEAPRLGRACAKSIIFDPSLTENPICAAPLSCMRMATRGQVVPFDWRTGSDAIRAVNPRTPETFVICRNSQSA
jgi:hypothetical protein